MPAIYFEYNVCNQIQVKQELNQDIDFRVLLILITSIEAVIDALRE